MRKTRVCDKSMSPNPWYMDGKGPMGVNPLVAVPRGVGGHKKQPEYSRTFQHHLTPELRREVDGEGKTEIVPRPMHGLARVNENGFQQGSRRENGQATPLSTTNLRMNIEAHTRASSCWFSRSQLLTPVTLQRGTHIALHRPSDHGGTNPP